MNKETGQLAISKKKSEGDYVDLDSIWKFLN